MEKTTTRKLATIQTIESFSPCPKESDRVHVAKMDGLAWKVMVRIDEFKIGDQCVYFEVDSILPEKEWSEFMRSRHFRVKTQKMRGVVSQGLIMPLSILPEGNKNLPNGHDVTELLEVQKHEEPVPNDMNMAGNFPSFMPKTDEMRLQSYPRLLDEIRGIPVYVAVKLDGSSGTFFKHEGRFGVCSRRFEIKNDTENAWTHVANKYNLADELPDGFAIQGEVVGPKMNGNRSRLPTVDLYVFNVFNIMEQRYLDYHEFINFCKEHKLQTVPIDRVVETPEELEAFGKLSVDEVIAMGDGKFNGQPREGVVIRTIQEMRSVLMGGDRMSFKAISNEYLLKEE